MTLRERLEASRALGAASQWLESRSQREQIALVALVCIAIAALVYAAVWSPLADARDRALADIAAHDAVLARVRAAGSALNAEALNRGPPSSLADSAAIHGLLIRRIEPEGEWTRIAFADAEFTQILAWIDGLEKSRAATLVALEIERRPAPGVVNASVALEAR